MYMHYSTHTSLRPYHTFSMDVYADRLYHIETVDDIHTMCQMVDFFHIQSIILGRGSNVLFTQDYHGIVLINMIM